jgi:hypothetical protein
MVQLGDLVGKYRKSLDFFAVGFAAILRRRESPNDRKHGPSGPPVTMEVA